MSRNPYLAASRPTSSFTRSSRSSKRAGADSLSASSRVSGGLLGRSRSSATLGAGLSSYLSGVGSTSGSGYVPSSNWQRSSSSSRATNELSPYTSKRTTYDSSKPATASIGRSTSSHNFGRSNSSYDDDGDDSKTQNVLYAPFLRL